jgi:hypothetical protein
MYIVTSSHIELEKTDDLMNWSEMKQLLNGDYHEYLLLHLELSRKIFKWNILFDVTLYFTIKQMV